jgi:hypothetical protein
MPTFTVEQVRAARAFLGWTQADLGEASDVSVLPILRKKARRLGRAKFREKERSAVGTPSQTSNDSVLLAKVELRGRLILSRLWHLSIAVDYLSKRIV